MHIILTVAIGVSLLTSLLIVILYGRTRLMGSTPVSLTAFMAILFTSGLDVGLIMFPLTEFPVYEADAAYGFTNPLAIEFGFWGFLVWAFYFLSTFYFCVLEPKLKLFEIRWIKWINNAVIIATCAFTGFLFFSYLPDYIIGISQPLRYGLVALVVLLAVLSSTDIRYVKWLSLGSSALFLLLILGLWRIGGLGLSILPSSLTNLSGYFTNVHKFVSPVSDYHAFYLFWWFAWSIMIGQFVARFVGGIKTAHLMLALLVLPSIPIAIWFSVLYAIHAGGIDIGAGARLAMVTVGIIFVINSLDSLTRLYSQNLGLTPGRLGKAPYVTVHWSLLFGLILLYQFTPMKIEWVGLVVIGLYAAIYALMIARRKDAAKALRA